ncbi:MAG: hypothetical protein Q8Q04_02850 [archaeon]|nr:hypothetical protein [archaeon]
MSLVEKLKEGVSLLILAGGLISFGIGHYGASSAFSEETQKKKEFIKKELAKKEMSGKKLALALITNHDQYKVFDRIEESFKKDFLDLPDYKINFERTKSIQEIKNCIERYSKCNKIDALILAYHGDKYSMGVKSFQKIDTLNVKSIFGGYSDSFSKDAIIILYSCSTGSGEDNIAKRLSDVLDRDVVAPKFDLTPESILKSWQRSGEFTPDENGRVSFDYKNFKVYLERAGLGGFSSPLIGTLAHGIYRGKLPFGEGGKDLFFFSDKNPTSKPQ